MKILHCTAEYFPFIKSGGLSDMLSSLSVAQAKLIDVSVAIPNISSIKEKISYTGIVYSAISETEPAYSTASKILKNSRFREAEFNGVKLYFFESALFDKISNIYANSDEHFHFAVFSYACYHLAKVLQVDVIHSHDWHTALTNVIVKNLSPKLKTCFTIHNLAYQGDHPEEICGFLRQDPFFLNINNLFHINKMNYMKSAIEVSDHITTVSPGYRDEVLNEPTGFFLSWLLKKRTDSFSGILNGINEDEWNPSQDKKIYSNYETEDLEIGKKENKTSLYEEFDLKIDLQRPLIGIVSRLSFQKGFSTFLNSFRQKFNLPFYYFILGTGEKDLEDSFFYESHNSSERLFFFKGFSETLARKVEAASDFFLMPSLFEPCGLNQLYSQRYGSIPIVSRVGGLKDSVIETWEEDKQTGFLFEAGLDHSLNFALDRAFNLFQNKEKFSLIRKRIMSLDWSWKKGVEEYNQIYKRIVSF